MRPSLLLLLLLLLPLNLGTNSTYIGCGTDGVGGATAVGCSSGVNDDPCDYIVTLQVTVLLAADDSPLPGATVYIDTGPSDSVNTKVADGQGQVFWGDTSFLTGFSASCGGQEVGTVEPYDEDTFFNYDLLTSAPGLAPMQTVLSITRQTGDIILTVRMEG